MQALRVDPFWWKVIWRNSFHGKFVRPQCIITNKPIRAQLSCAHLQVLFCVLKNLWQQWRKACKEIYWCHERMNSHGKACSKNNSLLQRVDLRVQHIWRIRVMGSCPNSISAYHHPSCEECREGRRSIDVNHTCQLEAFIYLSNSGFGSGSGSGFLGFHTPPYFGGIIEQNYKIYTERALAWW